MLCCDFTAPPSHITYAYKMLEAAFALLPLEAARAAQCWTSEMGSARTVDRSICLSASTSNSPMSVCVRASFVSV